MRRGLIGSVVLALVVATGACNGDDKRGASVATTTSMTTTTTSTTTTAPFAPAPNGCDASALTRVEPRADRTKYDVDATLDLAANQVTGTLKATFTPDRVTDQVVLRLFANAPSPAAAGAREDIADVTIDGKPVTFRTENPTTTFVDSGDLLPGRPIQLSLTFKLRLPGVVEDRLSRSGNTVRLGTWLPLLAWEPIGIGGVGGVWNIEPPTGNYAEASGFAAADFTVKLVTPPGLNVLATGVPDGDGRWTARAVPEWGASIADFRIAQGVAGTVPVTVGVERSMSESPNTYLARVISSLTDLARRYGAYPYPAFTLALTPSLKGGIEFPGHVMQGPNTNARTTPHEVAHQWFYSLVNNNQARDPWLDEGLATWAEAQINGSYSAFVNRSIPADARGRVGEPMTFWAAHRSSYYRGVYAQGMQTLAALGVSREAVDCALARYVAANAYRIVTPAALVAALKTVAPNAEEVLARFGAQRLS